MKILQLTLLNSSYSEPYVKLRMINNIDTLREGPAKN